MTAQLNPYQASPGTFSSTSLAPLGDSVRVTERLTAWLQSWVIQNQGPVLSVEAGAIKSPQGIDLPFGWVMVWVEVTAAVPDAEPDEVVLEEAEPEGAEEDPACAYPVDSDCRCVRDRGHDGLHQCRHYRQAGEPGQSHRPGCVLAPAHREAGTLACYGTPPGAETSGARWL